MLFSFNLLLSFSMCSDFGPNDFDEGSWAFNHIKARLSSQRCHFHFLCDYHLPHPTRKPLHSSSCTFVSESCQRSSKSGMRTLDLQSPCQIQRSYQCPPNSCRIPGTPAESRGLKIQRALQNLLFQQFLSLAEFSHSGIDTGMLPRIHQNLVTGVAIKYLIELTI